MSLQFENIIDREEIVEMSTWANECQPQAEWADHPEQNAVSAYLWNYLELHQIGTNPIVGTQPSSRVPAEQIPIVA